MPADAASAPKQRTLVVNCVTCGRAVITCHHWNASNDDLAGVVRWAHDQGHDVTLEETPASIPLCRCVDRAKRDAARPTESLTIGDMVREGSCSYGWAERNGFRMDASADSPDAVKRRREWLADGSPPPDEDMLRQMVHSWLELSYSQFLTLPRLVMQAMPGAWQLAMVELLRELDDAFDWRPKGGRYWVKLRDDAGRFSDAPLADYRRGSVEHLRRGGPVAQPERPKRPKYCEGMYVDAIGTLSLGDDEIKRRCAACVYTKGGLPMNAAQVRAECVAAIENGFRVVPKCDKPGPDGRCAGHTAE